MRLGLIGPASGDLAAVARAATLLVDRAGADRVLYLGDDDALEIVVASWARELVGANPADGLLFERAARACANADADGIARFLSAERARQGLKVFASVPRPPGKTLEILEGKLAVLLWDKASLDEEDIAGATYLVFGRSAAPVVRRVGARVFLSPGPIPRPGKEPSDGSTEPSGVAVLHDEQGVCFDVLDTEGVAIRSERLEVSRVTGTKLRIQ